MMNLITGQQNGKNERREEGEREREISTTVRRRSERRSRRRRMFGVKAIVFNVGMKDMS